MFRTAPTGIDRVEFAYAKELLGADAAIGVFTTPFFTGALRHARALDLLARVERAWNSCEEASTDPVFQGVRLWLETPPNPGARRARRFVLPDKTRSFLRAADFFPAHDFARARALMRRWLNRAESEAVYFHCSHTQLDKPRRFAWLERRNLPSVFFIHDTIPIEYPEYCSPGAYERHVKRLMTVSKFASLIIVNSEESRRAVDTALTERGARNPGIEVVPLGIDDAFRKEQTAAPIRGQRPYFLCVGTIEPRKNLLFLLAVWRRLIERMGEKTPRLVIAGRRGWENENIVDVLERSRTLAPFVCEASDLSDAGLSALMANAAAVVAPSFAEGFGLPVVEALAAGTPVIASDIQAHREGGGDLAFYADPVDGPAWISAIESLCNPRGAVSVQARAEILRYQPLSWGRHVEKTMRLIDDVVARSQAQRAPAARIAKGGRVYADEGRPGGRLAAVGSSDRPGQTAAATSSKSEQLPRADHQRGIDGL